MKEIRTIFFTDKGKAIFERLKETLDYDFRAYGKPQSLTEFCEAAFSDGAPLLFIGASGIAVRAIAPFVKDKLTDPPVIVMDELGYNVIPLLSGHYGGANKLALEMAEAIGGNPVITTATDINGAFSVDVFAKERELRIVNREGIAKVSTKALSGKAITLSIKNYPPKEKVDVLIDGGSAAGEVGENSSAAGVINLEGELASIADPGLIVGMGCRRGKAYSELKAFLGGCLKELGRNETEISAISTIDIKEEEQGIVDLAEELSVPLITFDGEILKKAPGEFTDSEFVKKTTGVDNVCERAALLAAGKKGRLIMRKNAKDGMTIAIAELEGENLE